MCRMAIDQQYPSLFIHIFCSYNFKGTGIQNNEQEHFIGPLE